MFMQKDQVLYGVIVVISDLKDVINSYLSLLKFYGHL